MTAPEVVVVWESQDTFTDVVKRDDGKFAVRHWVKPNRTRGFGVFRYLDVAIKRAQAINADWADAVGT